MASTRSDVPAGSGRRPDPAGRETESVPGYRELRRIGHGGFSVVYRAVQESFERDVALKVLTVGPDEDARGRFLREVRLAARLSGHPQVVTVLDTGTTGSGRPYLAMDLYDGGSMKQRLVRSGPLSAAETAVLGAKIAEALAAAHALGVLHRDVKPNNILISRFGEPALADFGVSCLLDSSSSASVLDVFSPQHAAPELITRGVPSASSDVYALGSTLYELVTGQPPFGAQGRDVRSVLWRALSEPAPRPDCPELPELADAIVRAMAKEPDGRFADAAEFARTLRSLIPEGTPGTLRMPAAPDPADLFNPAEACDGDGGVGDGVGVRVGDGEPATGSGAAWREPEEDGPDGHSDATSYRRAYAADETRVRPDRAGGALSGAAQSGAALGATDAAGEANPVRRLKRPLAAASAVVLLGAVGWAAYVSQGSSSAAGAGTAAPRGPVAPTTAGPTRPPSHARPSRGATTAKQVTASVEPASVGSSTRGPVRATTAASPTNTTGSLLSLIGTYHRFENEQSDGCLAQSSGAAPTAPACGASDSEGWEYSVPISGLLSSPGAGWFELVNEADGDCLTAGSGTALSMQACTGGSAQLWSDSGTGSSGGELRNAGDSQCLRAGTGAVSQGSCDSADTADLWSEDGTP